MNKQSEESEDLHETITRLYSIKDKPTAQLSPEERKDFHHLVHQVRLNYGTHKYGEIYKLIKTIFGEKNEDVIPGTVGAYCVGCMKKLMYQGSYGCTPFCAGSIAPPEIIESEYPRELCEDMVMLARWNGSAYDFSLLQMAPSDRMIIHLAEGDTFYGLNEEEIKYIETKGVKEIAVAAFDKDNQSFKEILGFRPLDQVPARLKTEQVITTNNGTDPALIALIIILILIIVYIAWKIYKERI